MNKILLIVFLFPFFGFAQVDLVRWDNASSFGQNVLVSNISSAPLSGANISSLSWAGFFGTQWPTGNFIDNTKYIQISITANAGYKVDLATVKYAYNPIDGNQGCRKYQIRYSENFTATDNGTLLIDEQSPSVSAKTNKVVSFPAGTFLLPGKTMYIRFYGYDRGNTGWPDARWGLLNAHPDVNPGGNTYNVPTITGNVSVYNPTLKANDDIATALKNNFTFIKVLANDTEAMNPISIVTIASNPTNSGGTVEVSADKTIKFIPTTGFVGNTSFTYTIADGVTTSTATVSVTVNNQIISNLVKWQGTTDSKGTIYAIPSTSMSAGDISGNSINYSNIQYEGFRGNSWPNTFSIDETTKYFEFTTTALEGYKIKLDRFNFTYSVPSSTIQRYQVRYSIDGFVTSALLLDEAVGTGKTNKSLSLDNLTLYPNQKLTIRIYAYKLKIGSDFGAPFFLMNSNTIGETGNTVPTITGTVLQYDGSDINANDDIVTTKQNKPVSFNILENDINHTSSILSYTQPPVATGVVINNNNILIFTPANNYVGNTSFTYTLTQGAKTSTATVYVSVTETQPSLIIWNGASQQSTAVVTNPNISAGNLTATGINMGIYNNAFNLSGLNSDPSTSSINLNKYVQISVSPKTNYKISLSQFKFIYNSPSGTTGATKYQVHYSTKADFSDDVHTLVGETAAVQGVDTEVLVSFPAGVVASGLLNQTLYIRIYPYGVADLYNGLFYIKHDTGGEVGPTIFGIVDLANVLTANPDTAITSFNTAVTIPVLTNDENKSGLQSITVTQPTNGTVVVNGIADVTFTPSNNFSGTSTFTYTLFNGKVYSSATVTVTVNAEKAARWTGTEWKDGLLPSASVKVVFEGDYSESDFDFNSNILYAKEIEIKSTAKVVIGSGKTLSVVWGVVNNGSLTFENTASLVQVEDAAVNSGKINYKRHTNYVKRYDFTYWSSPVKGQKMKALSPNTLFDKYYRYNPDAGWEISYSGVDTMKEGEGYIIRAPQSFSITNAAIDTNPMFVGEPNNGEIKKTIIGGKVYLLGNPYPSAIDADLFLNLNSTVLAGTLYFWTHNSPPRTGVPGGDAMYSYTTNDYATYNRTGGVGTAAITGGEPPTRNIGAGQGFFAPASATGGELIFKNEIRLLDNEVIDNSQFFKLSNSSKESKLAVATIEKNRLWLNLTNAEGAFKQTLIGYITGATNDYESSFDGITYDGNQYVDFYSINNAVNLSIQGRSLPFEKKDSVALGYKSTIKGDFKISIDHTDGVLSSQDIFLEDKDLKVLHDLKKSAYTFSVDKGVFNNRFVLRYVDKNEVEVIVPETPDEVLTQGVIVSVQERKITITADAALDKVVVYDMTGRKIFQKNNVNDSVFVVPYLLSSRQVLAVDIELLDGSKFSRKIVY